MNEVKDAGLCPTGMSGRIEMRTPDEVSAMLGIVARQRPNTEDDYTQINALAEQQRARGWKIRHIILGTGQVGERDLIDAVDVTGEKELVYSASLDDLTRSIGECHAIVSMKFHGTVVATMYGVPSTVLIPTNKNHNCMRRIGCDDLLSKFDDPTLCERFNPMPAPIDSAAVTMLRDGATGLMERLKNQLKATLV